jgi:hypothetical protein
MTKVLLLPVAKFNIKIVEAINPTEPIEKKFNPYLYDLITFEQMFNEGSLDLDRTYIKFIKDNQI